MKRIYIHVVLLVSLMAGWSKAEMIKVNSPDGRLVMTVTCGDTLEWSLVLDDQIVVQPSRMALELGDGSVLGDHPKITGKSVRSVDEYIEPPYGNAKQLRDHFNELTVDFKGDWSLVVRAYDEGAAYRFATRKNDELVIRNEVAEFRFAEDQTGWFSRADKGKELEDWQGRFANVKISKLTGENRAYLPSLINLEGSVKLAVLEADLLDYPGMYLEAGTAEGELCGWWASYPVEFEWSNWKNACRMPTKRADYIAKTQGTRSFPWRVVLVSEKDTELGYSDLVYQLSTPSRLKNTDWIQPGKAAWDWYNMFGIIGVDFKNGPNTQTWKAYIDFAAELDLEYAIIDEGWSDVFEITQLMPDVDLQELSDYAESKGVGLVLWGAGHILCQDIDKALDFINQFDAVKGIKIDFFQRNDQPANNMYVTIAEAAAKRELIVDFHGCYIPTGLRRTYPNILTWESIRGLEQNKWRRDTTPRHDVLAAYIRLLAGPMDYTPGAMRNAARKHHRPVGAEPMSQGTRCHQLAMYVVFDSPLQMLADTPQSYRNAGKETLDFLSKVPATWDETFVVDGRIPNYIIKGRKAGDSYYLGGLCDWEAREVDVKFDFLGEGEYTVRCFIDGVNADTFASDFKYVEMVVTRDSEKTIRMASGGGFSMHISKKP